MSAQDTRKRKSSKQKKSRPFSVTRAVETISSTVKPITSRTLVDEFEGRLPYTGTLPSNQQHVFDIHGEISFHGHNRIPLPGVHNVAQVFLRTYNSEQLGVKACIPKVLFGHNVAGHTHLPRAVKRVLKDVVRPEIEGTLQQPWKKPKRRDIELDWVALARHMQFETEEAASRAVEQIQVACAAHGLLGLVHKAGETYTTSPNRRLFTVTFYVKSKELRASKTASRNPRAAEVQAAVDGFLRVEVRLTRAALAKFGLQTLDRWKRDTADRVFSKVFDDFTFLALCPLKPGPGPDDSELPAPLMRAVTLVRSGTPIDAAYAPSSARRLATQAADYGLDLRAPPSNVDVPQVLLSPEKRWVTDVPDKAKRIPGFDKQYGAAMSND